MSLLDFNGANLAGALKKTFHHRSTDLPKEPPLFAEEIYDEHSDRQTLWKAFLQKNDIKIAPKTLATVANVIEKFLIKPLEALNKGREISTEWKASDAKWK